MLHNIKLHTLKANISDLCGRILHLSLLDKELLDSSNNKHVKNKGA